MSFKDLSKKLHLTEDDEPVIAPAQAAPAVAQPVHAAPAYTPSTFTASSYVPQVAADPEIVAKIKARVFSVSPAIAKFMENLDKARTAFGNDNAACVKAAITFTGVEKPALLQELNTTIAAALLHVKSDIDNDYKTQHDKAIGSLQSQLNAIDADVQSMTSQIAQLQQAIGTKQVTATGIKTQIQNAEHDLQQQHAGVTGSYTNVEQFVDTLRQSLT